MQGGSLFRRDVHRDWFHWPNHLLSVSYNYIPAKLCQCRHVRGIWYNNRFLTVNCCTCDHLTAHHLRHYDHSSGKCLILPPLFLIIIVCIDLWVTEWIYTLFSLLSLWPLVSATILGVTIVTLGMTPVVSGARMLMYGAACPCICLQASVHSCSAGPFFFGITSLWLQSKVKLLLTIILQKYLINFSYVTVNLHYVCIHPSMHLCLCVCMYAFVKCVCMHLYIIILCVVHSQR